MRFARLIISDAGFSANPPSTKLMINYNAAEMGKKKSKNIFNFCTPQNTIVDPNTGKLGIVSISKQSEINAHTAAVLRKN